MVMRIGGLASGMDIDELVEKLMTAERAPLNKLEQQKQTYEWQRDAYRSVNTKLKTLDTYIADNLILKKINTKTASSSNSNLVTSTATSSATGSVSIEGVSQLASSARAVGQQINATESTKLSTLIGSGAKSISLKGIKADGSMPAEATKIDITEGMTVSQFISKINASNAGVTAVFENGRFSFTAKNSGDNKAGDEIEVIDGQDVLSNLGFYKDATGAATSTFQTTEGKNAVFQVNGIATERASNTFTLNGYNISLKSTFNEATTHNANSAATSQTLVNATANINDLLTSLSSSYNVDLTPFSTIAEKVEAVKNEISAKVTDYQAAFDTANTTLTASLNQFYEDDKVKALSGDAKAFLHSLTKEQRDELAKKNLEELDVDQQDWTQDQKDKFTANRDELKDLSAASITNTIGKVYNKLSAEAKTYIADNSDFSNVSTSDLNDEEKALIASLSNDFKTIANQTADMNAAKATLNTAKGEANELVNTTNAYNNAVNANNTIGTAPVTTVSSAPIELTSTSNIDETLNKIKDFVNTYNTFIKELSSQTKEPKYRDYKPLTAEQKKEMDEDEIKLWEEKAKSGLLRNDSMIRNGLSNMRSLIYQSNPSIEDTRYNTLFNIGITTSKNYNDGGTLEIDETKLRKALEENPDAVEQLLKNTAGKKDDVIDGKTVDTRGYLEKLRESMKALEVNIEKRAGRSSMTDAQYVIGKNLMNTETRIKTWQDKLENIESRYWKQFTAMETAINKANSQSSLFMG